MGRYLCITCMYNNNNDDDTARAYRNARRTRAMFSKHGIIKATRGGRGIKKEDINHPSIVIVESRRVAEMQSPSKAKNKQTTLDKQITCHFACPWANADVSSEKSTKEIHASEKEKRNSNAPFAQTRKRFVPPSLPPPPLGGKCCWYVYVTPIDFPGLLAQNTKAEIPTEEEKREVFATRQLGHA
jgi:hypothetical protein